MATQGTREFGDVRLAAAEKSIGTAMRLLTSLRYHMVNPSFLAKLSITRGQALLEAKRPADAESAFQFALSIQPSVRLRSGFDHPQAVSAFEAARLSMIRSASDVTGNAGSSIAALGSKTLNRIFYRWTGNAIYGRLTENQLEVVIDSPRGIQVERQTLTSNPVLDGEQLASRIHAALPFGRVSRDSRSSSDVLMNVGFAGFTHLKSPVGLVPNYGVNSTGAVVLAQGLSVEVDTQLSISGRDFHEHLREDIMSFQFRLGLGARGRIGRFSGSAHLGLQLDRLSEVVITTTAACKYFSPQDAVPRTLCDFQRDFDRIAASWSLGPALSLEGRFNLFDQVDLVARISAATYVFRTVEHDFAWPVGATAGLGYRFD